MQRENVTALLKRKNHARERILLLQRSSRSAIISRKINLSFTSLVII